MVAIAKYNGTSVIPELPAEDFPHTITYALLYRARINSYQELPDDKQPRRHLWDKPWRLKQHFDEVFKSSSEEGKGKTYIEFNPEEVEG